MAGRYTVNKVARMAGVSVRTLHHYDEIGLLVPAFIGENRYRFYGEQELLRLQQILIHRELGLSLAEIGEVLDAPDFDRLATLRRQRERIEEASERYARLLETIDRTIARLEGHQTMKNEDLYTGAVDPQKQAEYEAWLLERHGPGTRDLIESGKAAISGLAPEDIDRRMADLREIESGLAASMQRGVPAQARELDELVSRHREWVSVMWGQPASLEAYAGLAETYLAHPDFRARYEQIAPGFTEYLTMAMKSWSHRQGK